MKPGGSTKEWRYISDPARSGILNMAIDELFLLDLESQEIPQTIFRCYEWSRPTLSLGQHQKRDRAADVEFCARHGIDVVVRPTGGRAVLHDKELTYAVVSNDQEIFGCASVLATYKRIASGLCRGLRRLGVVAVLADSPTHSLSAPENPNWVKDPCFNSPSRYELMVEDRKLIGSAQRRLQRSFLQHGSLLLDCDIPMLAAATRADEQTLSKKITTLRSLRGEAIGRDEIEAALLHGLAEEFSVAFQERPLTEQELAAAQRLKNVIFQGVSA